MKKIYFITGNKGKYLEVSNKLSTKNIEVIQKNLGYPEIQANTLKEVANFGLNHIKKEFNRSFILEDAGLFINDINKFPGVYSSYVYHTIGCEGVLKLLDGFRDEKRKACFRSVIGYMDSKGNSYYFTGESYGKISKKQLGTNGFGYDPIFIPEGTDKTFAQMKVEEKNNYSHRGKSLDKLINFLTK